MRVTTKEAYFPPSVLPLVYTFKSYENTSLLPSRTVGWKPKPFMVGVFSPPHVGVNSLEHYAGLLDSNSEGKSDLQPSVTHFET